MGSNARFCLAFPDGALPWGMPPPAEGRAPALGWRVAEGRQVGSFSEC